jgi:hypothetical protein
MFSHIDEVGGCLYGCKGGVGNGFGLTHKSDHSPVRGRAWIDMEQLHTFDVLYFVCDLADDAHIASLTEVWNAFD